MGEYERHIGSNGEIITADKLNNIECGVEESTTSSSSGISIVYILSDGGDDNDLSFNYYVNGSPQTYTYQQMSQLYAKGPVFAKYVDLPSSTTVGYESAGYEVTLVNNKYVVHGNVFNHYRHGILDFEIELNSSNEYNVSIIVCGTGCDLGLEDIIGGKRITTSAQAIMDNITIGNHMSACQSSGYHIGYYDFKEAGVDQNGYHIVLTDDGGAYEFTASGSSDLPEGHSVTI